MDPFTLVGKVAPTLFGGNGRAALARSELKGGQGDCHSWTFSLEPPVGVGTGLLTNMWVKLETEDQAVHSIPRVRRSVAFRTLGESQPGNILADEVPALRLWCYHVVFSVSDTKKRTLAVPVPFS